ncbi:HD domain-containing protein [Nannocystaceae bacterium ST9]
MSVSPSGSSPLLDRAHGSDSIHARLLAPVIEAGRTGQTITIEPEALERAELIRDCSPARLWTDLTAALCGKHPHVAMQTLHDAGLLIHVLPELAATVDFSQESGRRHKDVWEHTKTVVWQSVPRPEIRWAAALHDIGKVPTRRFLPEGKVTFHGHAEVGVRMFLRGPAKRIEFPPAARERIAELIRHHLRPGQYDASWTESAIRRFARELGPHLDDLLLLSRADVTSKRPGKRKRCLRSITALSHEIRRLAAEDAKPKPLPSGLGNMLMSALELPPGKHIGELRSRLQALFDAGEIAGGREADYYVEQVRERDLLAGVDVRKP